jgi:hypothetical protein
MPLSPPSEAIYTSVDTAVIAIQAHAKANGYAFSRVTTRPSRVIFACDRAGKYDSRGKDLATDASKRRKAIGSKKYGCLMKEELCRDSICLDQVSSDTLPFLLKTNEKRGLLYCSSTFINTYEKSRIDLVNDTSFLFAKQSHGYKMHKAFTLYTDLSLYSIKLYQRYTCCSST